MLSHFPHDTFRQPLVAFGINLRHVGLGVAQHHLHGF